MVISSGSTISLPVPTVLYSSVLSLSNIPCPASMSDPGSRQLDKVQFDSEPDSGEEEEEEEGGSSGGDEQGKYYYI